MYSNFVHYQREKLTMLLSQGKITLFFHPRQQRQKYVVPEFVLKAQSTMSGIRK
jgi:hypothetical protein